jgi:hypothetical protein
METKEIGFSVSDFAVVFHKYSKIRPKHPKG